MLMNDFFDKGAPMDKIADSFLEYATALISRNLLTSSKSSEGEECSSH